MHKLTLRRGAKFTFNSTPSKTHHARVQRLIRQEQFTPILRRQRLHDELQIARLVAAVNFVADNWMSVVREVNANLVLAPRARQNSQPAKFPPAPLKPARDVKLRLRGRTIRAHRVLDGDDARFVLAQRRVDETVLLANMPMNNGGVFFFHGARFPNGAELAGGFGIFCNDDEAARFAVEAVDQMRADRFTLVRKINPHPADEAGINVSLGRMADEARRFVDHQQVGVFVNHIEQMFHRCAAPDGGLSSGRVGVSFRPVKEKVNVWLPVTLLVVFAATRWPGLMPQNFSAAYAIAFCGAVYISGKMAWWLPLGTLLVTDIALNVFYYHVTVFSWYMLVKTLGFVGIVALGKLFSPRNNWFQLLGGGLLGAILFYFITNTASWIYNPGYVKTLAGWWQALTTGIPGLPPTWEFFRNTLISAGLFTALFVAAVKLTAPAESPAEKESGVREPEAEDKESAHPEESQA